MNLRIRTFLFVVLFALCLTSCKPHPHQEFLEGGWVFVDPHLNDVIGQSYLEHIWVFTEGRFSYETCCLREIYMRGFYRVAESGEDFLILDLYDIQANEMAYQADQQIRITLDPVGDTIKVALGGPYIRLNP